MNIAVEEYEPDYRLKDLVHSYWAGDFNVSRQSGYTQQVLPNGCIEVIIHLSDAHCSLFSSANGWGSSPDFTLIGMYSQPYEVRFESKVNVFGIRLYPDGVRQIFGVPPVELLAAFEDGVHVGGQSFYAFCNRIKEINNIAAQLQLSNAFLLSKIDETNKKYDYTHLALRLIRESHGAVDFTTLLELIPISSRQLQRELKKAYGITLSDYMRLSRMNAIQRYMLSGSKNLTQLTYKLQFSDQSHFTREFKKYAGITPGKFVKNQEEYILNPV